MAEFHVHVDAIVRRGDEILIMKRAMGFMSSAWYFPGGQLEHGETPEEGARREIMEETGLKVEGLELFRTWTYQPAQNAFALAVSYTASVPPGTEPTINEEHLAFRWVRPEYYRDRFVNDEVLASLKENPSAYSVSTAVRRLVDDYIDHIGAATA
jgi:mutator protein MutT